MDYPISTTRPGGVGLAELLKVVRQHEAAIVAAHPFRWDQTSTRSSRQHGPAFDALELVSNNVTPETRQKTEALLREAPDGGDGLERRPRARRSAATTPSSPVPIETLADFIAALRQRTGRPRHRPGAWQASGPVD